MTEVYVIAEAGVNHNGDLQRAMLMVDAAAEAGADAIKFQTFDPNALVTKNAPQADYQIRNDGDSGSQFAMLQRLVLSHENHHRLMARCAERKIDFMSTPFDPASAHFLIDELQLPRLKLGSGELTNGPLLLQIAQAGRPLILSTGMATLSEIRDALGVLAFGFLGEDAMPSRAAFVDALQNPQAQSLLQERVSLLHCTTEYPCPPDQVNLRAMDTLAETFGLTVGYSDHTLGIHVALAAVARGAKVIEKHFTLDRQLPGPDHLASLEPNELENMVNNIRDLSLALGSADKVPRAIEQNNRVAVRKSLIAAKPIRSGEAFTADNITVKRPGTGRSPMAYWEMLGQIARQDYDIDEVIQ